MRPDEENFLEQLSSLSRIEDSGVVQAALESVRPEDVADAFPRLEFDEQLSLLRHLTDESAAYVLVELPTETSRALIHELPDETVAHYLDILPMDDALDLGQEMDPDRFEAILEVIPPEDAQEIRRLMSYPDDSVGRLATEAFFEVTPESTMADILADIRRSPKDKYESIHDIYVLDQGRHLIGVFSLKKALREELTTQAEAVMRSEVVSVQATDSAEEAARTISRYGFAGIPVLDRRGRMIGLFTSDDAHAILEEKETEDVLALGAVSGNVEAYLSLNIWQIVKRRLPWLLILFVAEMLTGTVLRHYMGQGEQGKSYLAQLSFFIPLLIGAGGNAGSQVTTTITRALALSDIKPSDAGHVFLRELFIAIIIGFTLGLIGFIRGYLLWHSEFQLSLVVGIALPAIVIWAAAVGSLLPLAAKRIGIDPAVMSAPFITTFVDATGLIIYFEIARGLLPI